MTDSQSWRVLDSRDLLDASPFLKVRVETVELPNGRRVDDYHPFETPSFACVLAETEDRRIAVNRQ